MTAEHFRVLTAIEMGMRNHELVRADLIEQIAKVKRGNSFKIVQHLLKHKLIFHKNIKCDGYALTWMGYDYLSLNVFMKRGLVKRVGPKIGVGKESEIYLCETPEEGEVVAKFTRLGRTSFKTVKQNRDYLQNRNTSNWLYISRLSALKEYAFMKTLSDRDYPVPTPVDQNRHAILMSRVDAYPMTQVAGFAHPEKVYVSLINLIIKLAENGLIHGDFNEFNLMINDNEEVTLIDFPQMVSTDHQLATEFFDRDVKCIQDYFAKKYNLEFEVTPRLDLDVTRGEVDLDKEVKASGFIKENLKDINQLDLVEAAFEGEGDEEERDGEEEKEEEKPSEEQVEGEGETEAETDTAEPTEGEPKTEEQPEEAPKKKKKVKKIIDKDYVKDRVKKHLKNKNTRKRR